MTTKTTKEVFVAVKNLSVVWVQAQRPFQETWAKKIADEFDTDKFDPPVITKPNGEGKYHIVEGQHRTWAVKHLFGENEQIKCRMVDAEDPARAAEIFLGINKGRKAIKPVTSFLVAVTANREPEVEINRLVHKLGYKISLTKGNYCIGAVSSLIHVHKRQGVEVLHAALSVLDKTWPGDCAAFQGELIKGYSVFINEFPHVQPTRLAEVVKKAWSPGQVVSASRLVAEQHKIPLSEAMSDTLRGKYNYKAKDETKLRKK
jgi:hypothetical protein